MSATTSRRGPQARVQKQRNNGATRRQDITLKALEEPSRWQRMDYLRQHSARHGQKMCGTAAAVEDVTVQRSADGVYFGGLLTCGSRTCPNCGPRIAAQTRREIEQAIGTWMDAGIPTRRLLFGTFTIRHTRGQAFEDLARAVSGCWKAATNGRGWRNDRMQYGIEHYMRIFEEKWSLANGWHIHVHALLFVDDRYAASSDTDALLASMFKRWAGKAVELGFGVPLLRAQDMHTVTGAQALDRVAGYFAKQTTDAGHMPAPAMAAEMSNAAGKQGLTSLTPGQILSWAMVGEEYVVQLWGSPRPRAKGRGTQGQEYARHLYREYELGMKGRRQIAWSRGMREALGIGRELSDEELAAREEAVEQATAATLVSITGTDWRTFCARPGRRAELHARAATATRGELVEWLSTFGIAATPYARGREPDIGPCFLPDDLPF